MPKTKKIDYLFLFSVLALSAIGVIMIFSASPVMGLKHGDALYYIKRHIFYFMLGLGALYYGFRLDLEQLKMRAAPLLAVSVLCLLLVFLPGIGRKISGASRWIDFGILSFQPSELIKFAMVLFLARWLTENKRNILPLLALFGLIALLILRQPDLGTIIILGATFFAMLFMAGINIYHLLGLGMVGVLGIVAVSLKSAYRLRRFVAYFDPWRDPQGVGFHIIQSLLAVGSGGIMGLGLGASRQKFFYLPQQFTDFIFAILCEETGLVGSVAVILLLIVFAVRGLKIALSTTDKFSCLLAGGLVSWLVLQSLINIMVVLGLIPTTGIPLPFISYGGTATIINLFSVGVVLNISRRKY